MLKYIILFLFFIVSCVISELSHPLVTTKYGKIKGIVKKLNDGSAVNVFHGIRYGKSTEGERRFAPPIPVDPWNDTYDATKYRLSCIQSEAILKSFQFMHSETSMSEDCLFLSVYAPSGPNPKQRSVMFWIYGGGFVLGSIFSHTYDARYIASLGDVIVVTVNYRLGPFGFLYGGSDDAPGNVGLLDQLLALKWTHENIKSFGGNPNSITIFGESAGGISVGYLVLSPLSKGLFQRAILQSGSPNVLYGDSINEATIKTINLSHNLLCNHSSIHDVIKCLRSKNTNDILKSVDPINSTFIPIYGDKLIPAKPSVALREGKFNNDIQMLFGHCKDEGALFVVYVLKVLDPKRPLNITLAKAKEYINLGFSIMNVPLDHSIAEFCISGHSDKTENDKIKLSQAIASCLSDYSLTCPLISFGKNYALWKNTNKAYAYRLSHSSALHMNLNCIGWMGVCHEDDVPFIFGLPIELRGLSYTESDYKMSRDMIHIWTSFAKYGKPPSLDGIDWPEAINRNIPNPSVRFMDLIQGEYRVVNDFYKQTCDGFWKKYLN